MLPRLALLLLALILHPAFLGADDNTVAAGNKTAVPVVAFQFPDRWLGLNSANWLLDVAIVPEAGVVLSCRGREADASELETLRRLTATLLAEVPATDAVARAFETEEEQTSFVRCSVWLDSRHREYHFPQIIQAHAQLRILCETIEKLTGAAPRVEFSGFALAEDLDRRFGPEQVSYAELYARQGQRFASAGPEQIRQNLPPIAGAIAFPGTLLILNEQQRGILQRMPYQRGRNPFLEIDGRHYQIRLWSARGSAPAADQTPAHPVQRSIKDAR